MTFNMQRLYILDGNNTKFFLEYDDWGLKMKLACSRPIFIVQSIVQFIQSRVQCPDSQEPVFMMGDQIFFTVASLLWYCMLLQYLFVNVTCLLLLLLFLFVGCLFNISLLLLVCYGMLFQQNLNYLFIVTCCCFCFCLLLFCFVCFHFLSVYQLICQFMDGIWLI